MRIIAGRMKGLRLAHVGKGDTGAHLRPTTDRVRENLFNILNNHVDFDDMIVLDLFAGTGALGLEALSRGATSVTFVENGRVGQKLIAENIALSGTKECTTFVGRDVLTLGQGTPHDVIFLDPPYGKSLGERALPHLWAQGWIAPDALIIWEEGSAPDIPAGFTCLTQRRYGNTTLTLMEPA